MNFILTSAFRLLRQVSCTVGLIEYQERQEELCLFGELKSSELLESK